jgi:hypothetical protein
VPRGIARQTEVSPLEMVGCLCHREGRNARVLDAGLPREDRPAAAYMHKGRRLAVAAGWAAEPITASLDIDWKAAGLNPGRVCVTVPEIGMFQPALAPVSLDAIPVEPDKGWIVLAEARHGRETDR